MKFQNLFLTSAVALSLIACQSKNAQKSNANEGPFQCIAATITVAGKPMTTVIEWNANTGMARLLDTMVVTSKATGAQNIAIGWVPLGDLQNSIQDLIARNQAASQAAPAAPAPTASNDASAAMPIGSKKKK